MAHQLSWHLPIPGGPGFPSPDRSAGTNLAPVLRPREVALRCSPRVDRGGANDSAGRKCCEGTQGTENPGKPNIGEGGGELAREGWWEERSRQREQHGQMQRAEKAQCVQEGRAVCTSKREACTDGRGRRGS